MAVETSGAVVARGFEALAEEMRHDPDYADAVAAVWRYAFQGGDGSGVMSPRARRTFDYLKDSVDAAGGLGRT